jgi:hypothetical protein
MPERATTPMAIVIFINMKSMPFTGGKNKSHRYRTTTAIEIAMSNTPITRSLITAYHASLHMLKINMHISINEI